VSVLTAGCTSLRGLSTVEEARQELKNLQEIFVISPGLVRWQNCTRQYNMVLLDNTVLSNFALIRRTDIITSIWQNCVTTQDAWAAAYHRKVMLATDDQKARAYWSRWGVKNNRNGRLSCLCMNYGFIDQIEANSLLQQMIAFGYRSL